MSDPNLFAARALRQALADAGIAVTGHDPLDRRLGTLRGDARPRRRWRRPSRARCRDWIFPILNTSQNLFAEMLLKQLGKRFGRAGSWVEGIRSSAAS